MTAQSTFLVMALHLLSAVNAKGEGKIQICLIAFKIKYITVQPHAEAVPGFHQVLSCGRLIISHIGVTVFLALSY